MNVLIHLWLRGVGFLRIVGIFVASHLASPKCFVQERGIYECEGVFGDYLKSIFVKIFFSFPKKGKMKGCQN